MSKSRSVAKHPRVGDKIQQPDSPDKLRVTEVTEDTVGWVREHPKNGDMDAVKWSRHGWRFMVCRDADEYPVKRSES